MKLWGSTLVALSGYDPHFTRTSVLYVWSKLLWRMAMVPFIITIVIKNPYYQVHDHPC